MASTSFDRPSSVWIMCFGFIAMTFFIIAGIYHFWLDTHRKRRRSSASLLKKTIHWQRIGMILTYCGLICYILQTLSIAVQPFELARNDLACDIWEFFATLFYHWSKGCLYALFITRLQIGFGNSAHAYSKTKIIYPLFVVLFIYIIVVSIADYTDVNSKWNDEIESCEPEWALWGLLLTVLMDLVFSLICFYLFTKPLCKLAEYCKNEKNPEDARKFEVLVRKYSTLVGIAISSSLIMIFVAAGTDSSDVFQATLLQTLIILDNIINVSCMLLLSSNHNKLFGSICKMCLPAKMREYPEFSRTRVVSSNVKMAGDDSTRNGSKNIDEPRSQNDSSGNINVGGTRLGAHVTSDSGYNSENNEADSTQGGNITPRPDADTPAEP